MCRDVSISFESELYSLTKAKGIFLSSYTIASHNLFLSWTTPAMVLLWAYDAGVATGTYARSGEIGLRSKLLGTNIIKGRVDSPDI